MAKLLDSRTKLDAVKAFLKNTITSFGLVVILRAVMAPHALRDSAR